MAVGREAIYQAVFDQLNSVLLVANGGPFRFSSRRYAPVGTLGSGSYPAFFLTEMGEDYDRSVLFRPANVTLFAHVIIQTREQAKNVITATEVNNLADAVEDALLAFVQTTGQNTLNGLVQEAWINSRQIQAIASIKAEFSEQDLTVEIVLPEAI